MKNLDSTGQGGTDLFALGQQRLQWLQTRQNVLAGNIANANTPDYAARDVTPFSAALSQFSLSPVATQAGHIGHSANQATPQTITTEESLDHNGIALDQQMEKVAEVNDQQHYAVNLYGKYMSMFQTVLGK